MSIGGTMLRTNNVVCNSRSLLGALVAGCFLLIVHDSTTALGADDKPSTSDAVSLWPLKKGTVWEFKQLLEYQKTYNETDPIHRKKLTVTDSVLFNKLACYELVEYSYGVTPSDRREYLTVKDDGWYQVGRHSGPGDEEPIVDVYDPIVCILKKPSDKQQSWTCSYKTHTTFKNKTTVSYPTDCEFHQFPNLVKYQGKDVEATLVVQQETFWLSGTSSYHSYKKLRWYLPGKGLIREETHTKDDKTNKWSISSARETSDFSGDQTLKIGTVVFGNSDVEKEASSELVEAPPGVVTEFIKSRTIKREISYSTKIGIGVEVEAQLAVNLAVVKGDLTTRVKGSIEAERGEKLSDEETRTQTVKIDGDKLQSAKIVWIDIYKAGTIEVTQAGKIYKIPFQFPLGTRLVVRKQ